MNNLLSRDYSCNFIVLTYSKRAVNLGLDKMTFIFSRNLLLSIFLAFVMLGCDKNQNHKAQGMDINKTTISDETKQSMQTIKDSRILFAHKSVGTNILSGLKSLSDETGIELTIENIDNKSTGNKSMFAHSSGGKNAYPKTKIDSFTDKLRKLNKEFVPEVAFMKLCYVDIKPDTNVKEVFSYYQDKIEAIKKEKPDTTFVHLTVPLESKPNSIKAKVKRLLGLQVWQDASNIKRNEFNKLVNNSFHGDPVFDIARVESTRKDGSREQFTDGGKNYFSMSPEYTTDGGHLNRLGQHIVATEMVNFLGKTIEAKKLKIK